MTYSMKSVMLTYFVCKLFVGWWNVVVVSDVTDMCRKMARTAGDSSDDSDSDVDGTGRWRRPPPSDDECDDAITLKSYQLRSSQRDANIVLNIRVIVVKKIVVIVILSRGFVTLCIALWSTD